MSPHRNVPIGDPFVDALRSHRTRLHLTKAELAETSGLSIRTIQDLEAGRKSRIQEKTLILLAEALGVETDELLGKNAPPDATTEIPPPPERLRSRRRLAAFTAMGLLAVLASAALAGWTWSRTNAEWELADGRVVVTDRLFGSELWNTGKEGRVRHCIVSPWSDRHLIVGTNQRDEGGGRLLCLNRADGDTVWSVAPDVEAARRAFGPEIVDAAHFSSNQLARGDVDGDGVDELVAGFNHGLYYPHAICIVGPDGERRSQYVNRGHLFHVLVADIDGDGKDEIITAGTNNGAAHNSGTLIVLDDEHCRGAAVDAFAPAWDEAVDSSLTRIVFPRFPDPVMTQMKTTRLTARSPRIMTDDVGAVTLSVDVGDPKLSQVGVHLDTGLRPLGSFIRDSFLEIMRAEWPDSLRAMPGPEDAAWRAEWLERCKVFEGGVLVSGTGTP